MKGDLSAFFNKAVCYLRGTGERRASGLRVERAVNLRSHPMEYSTRWGTADALALWPSLRNNDRKKNPIQITEFKIFLYTSTNKKYVLLLVRVGRGYAPYQRRSGPPFTP
jgi:hypothetical protein